MSLPSAEWLPLLQRLTHVSDHWGVWKNADRALAGKGDVDSVAPAAEHASLREEFAGWASHAGLRWIVECRHAGGILVLVAVSQSEWAQLDLVWESPFRGARLFSAEDLLPLMTTDPRGFRRLREGAEGLFLFLYKGLRWGGRSNWQNLRQYDVLAKLVGDWEGAQATAALLRSAGDPLLRAAVAAVEGGWNGRAQFRAEAITALRALSDPGMLASRAFARAWSLPRCSVNRAIKAGRQPPLIEEWLKHASDHHAVQDLGQHSSN